MREIKFRAWDVVDKKWAEDDYLEIWLKHPHRLKVMQFTSLKDKNGKEIWEGDIVKCRGLSTVENVLVEDIMNIPVQITAWPSAYGKGNGDCEVIGNIFENPKLVK